jgi:hypothetical protein
MQKAARLAADDPGAQQVSQVAVGADEAAGARTVAVDGRLVRRTRCPGLPVGEQRQSQAEHRIRRDGFVESTAVLRCRLVPPVRRGQRPGEVDAYRCPRAEIDGPLQQSGGGDGVTAIQLLAAGGGAGVAQEGAVGAGMGRVASGAIEHVDGAPCCRRWS